MMKIHKTGLAKCENLRLNIEEYTTFQVSDWTKILVNNLNVTYYIKNKSLNKDISILLTLCFLPNDAASHPLKNGILKLFF